MRRMGVWDLMGRHQTIRDQLQVPRIATQESQNSVKVKNWGIIEHPYNKTVNQRPFFILVKIVSRRRILNRSNEKMSVFFSKKILELFEGWHHNVSIWSQSISIDLWLIFLVFGCSPIIDKCYKLGQSWGTDGVPYLAHHTSQGPLSKIVTWALFISGWWSDESQPVPASLSFSIVKCDVSCARKLLTI